MNVENTDLKRLVLAHEQILQPKFLDEAQHTGRWRAGLHRHGRIRRAVYPASGAPETQSAPQVGLLFGPIDRAGQTIKANRRTEQRREIETIHDHILL